MSDIRTLREAVEAGTLHKEKYGGMPLATACYPRDQNGRMLPDAGGWSDGNVIDAYHGSLDAAKALHDALLPNYGYGVGPWGARVWLNSDEPTWERPVRQEVDLDFAPARAWLIAILKALESRDNG